MAAASPSPAAKRKAVLEAEVTRLADHVNTRYLECADILFVINKLQSLSEEGNRTHKQMLKRVEDGMTQYVDDVNRILREHNCEFKERWAASSAAVAGIVIRPPPETPGWHGAMKVAYERELATRRIVLHVKRIEFSGGTLLSVGAKINLNILIHDRKLADPKDEKIPFCLHSDGEHLIVHFTVRPEQRTKYLWPKVGGKSFLRFLVDLGTDRTRRALNAENVNVMVNGKAASIETVSGDERYNEVEVDLSAAPA